MAVSWFMRLSADFNGLFNQLVCLSHGETCHAPDGTPVVVVQGMSATAWEKNEENGLPDDLLAHGIVEPSPEWLQCRGSRWALRIDHRGVRHESELTPEERADYQ
ncbi:MAG: hypothetical protein WA414_17580 [Acidobacteriaceae bacterium]